MTVYQMSPFERRVSRQVGENVRKQRKRCGVSRETMGRWLGHNSDAIAKAERGERRFSIADLIRISLELGCEVENLIGPPPK